MISIVGHSSILSRPIHKLYISTPVEVQIYIQLRMRWTPSLVGSVTGIVEHSNNGEGSSVNPEDMSKQLLGSQIKCIF